LWLNHLESFVGKQIFCYGYQNVEFVKDWDAIRIVLNVLQV